MFIWGSN